MFHPRRWSSFHDAVDIVGIGFLKKDQSSGNGFGSGTVDNCSANRVIIHRHFPCVKSGFKPESTVALLDDRVARVEVDVNVSSLTGCQLDATSRNLTGWNFNPCLGFAA